MLYDVCTCWRFNRDGILILAEKHMFSTRNSLCSMYDLGTQNSHPLHPLNPRKRRHRGAERTRLHAQRSQDDVSSRDNSLKLNTFFTKGQKSIFFYRRTKINIFYKRTKTLGGESKNVWFSQENNHFPVKTRGFCSRPKRGHFGHAIPYALTTILEHAHGARGATGATGAGGARGNAATEERNGPDFTRRGVRMT